MNNSGGWLLLLGMGAAAVVLYYAMKEADRSLEGWGK